MKYLIFALCLVLVGCAGSSHHSRSKKTEDENIAGAIQRVLDARRDIRAVISHTPANPEELAGVADMDPNAMIFSARDFVQRLQTISLKGCPGDFKDAFANYITAWQERSTADPGLMLLLNPVNTHPDEAPAVSAEGTEAAWETVKTICTTYGVTAN